MTQGDFAYPASASAAECYAAGRMTQSEELAFETRLLEDPELIADVETIYRMQEGFRLLHARGELQALVRGRRFVRIPYYALAAVFVLCVLGLALVLNVTSMRTVSAPVLVSSLADLRGAPLVPDKVLLVHMRSEEQSIRIAGGAKARVLALTILPAGTSPTYRATLERVSNAGATSLASNVEAHAVGSGYVSLYLDARRLMPGVYRLTLSQPSGSEEFLLTVTPAP